MRKREYATSKNTKIFEATIARDSGPNIDLRVAADNWNQAEIIIALWLQKEDLANARIASLQEIFYERVITLTTATEEV